MAGGAAALGVEDFGLAFVAPLSPGHFGYPDEVGHRIPQLGASLGVLRSPRSTAW
ncbi:hypothetical protein [Actinokineospora inagensis]|uniref:hypothetical protein n=1 Tax=Actinokineospora inagensis TaxID=103730 RepID=UPI00040AFCEA|nr:hypothetical protein [Actinokineospora inagensis]